MAAGPVPGTAGAPDRQVGAPVEGAPAPRRGRRPARAGLAVLMLGAMPIAGWVALGDAPPPEWRTLDVPPRAPGTLRILSLNVAHGRGLAFHQAFTRPEQIRQNLDAIARLVREADADVVALQELDAASAWSGGFDHLQYLVDRTGHGYGYQGIHVNTQRPRLAYGTGVLSRFPLREEASYRFAQNVLDTKGFVFTHLEADGLSLDLVSVHLDFKRSRERRAQLELMEARIRELRGDARRPLVIAGDFNCTVDDDGAGVPAFLRQLDLASPDDTAGTFPSRRPRRRIDHVLVSGLNVTSSRVLPAQVSDHLGVLVEVAPRRP